MRFFYTNIKIFVYRSEAKYRWPSPKTPPIQGRPRLRVFYFCDRASDCILNFKLKRKDWNEKEAIA